MSGLKGPGPNRGRIRQPQWPIAERGPQARRAAVERVPYFRCGIHMRDIHLDRVLEIVSCWVNGRGADNRLTWQTGDPLPKYIGSGSVDLFVTDRGHSRLLERA